MTWKNWKQKIGLAAKPSKNEVVAPKEEEEEEDTMTHPLVLLRLYIFQCRITQGHIKTHFIYYYDILCVYYVRIFKNKFKY